MKNILKSTSIVLILFISFVLFVLSNGAAGFRAFVVSSGSMEPTIPTGSLAVTHYVHPQFLKKGDVITFIAPTREHEFVTHRIMDIKNNGNLTAIKTQGDRNKNLDNWILMGGGVVGKLVYNIPTLGYFFSFARSKIGIFFLVLLPCIYIIYEELGFIAKLLKREETLKDPEILKTLLTFLFVGILSLRASRALLFDQVTLNGNQFALVVPTSSPTPTPTLTPSPIISPTPGACDSTINISGNGAGSKNIAKVICDNSSTTIQNNNTNSTAKITIVGENGENTSSGKNSQTIQTGISTTFNENLTSSSNSDH